MNNKLILFFGILIGLFFVLYGVIVPNQKLEEPNAIVSVNGHPIYQTDLELALQALSMNKRNCLLYTSPSPRDQRGWG